MIFYSLSMSDLVRCLVWGSANKKKESRPPRGEGSELDWWVIKEEAGFKEHHHCPSSKMNLLRSASPYVKVPEFTLTAQWGVVGSKDLQHLELAVDLESLHDEPIFSVASFAVRKFDGRALCV